MQHSNAILPAKAFLGRITLGYSDQAVLAAEDRDRPEVLCPLVLNCEMKFRNIDVKTLPPEPWWRSFPHDGRAGKQLFDELEQLGLALPPGQPKELIHLRPGRAHIKTESNPQLVHVSVDEIVNVITVAPGRFGGSVLSRDAKVTEAVTVLTVCQQPEKPMRPRVMAIAGNLT
ncbi:MAG: hypothetical protein JWO51_4994 [Rhodospirillales bacterium]|nr:hypothetical protein [Rhodospirillales bacterium]